jgi:deazaflavin-dependent oxidoreductase (nitroreductase family)
MWNANQFPGLQVLYLTTTGRISGQPRTIEIWFVAHEGDLYILAEHHHRADWVKNIAANPLVHVRIGGHELDARGRILDPALDADLWRTIQSLAREKYGWGEGLPVQLKPV